MMKKQTLALIHWNQGEREQRAKELRRAGYDVLNDLPAGSGILRTIEGANPSAIIIDLTRIPSRGRDLGIAFRKRKGTRLFPLIFAGGDPVKVEKIKGLLPDAHYCEWRHIRDCIHRAIEEDPEEVVVPDSVFAAYADKPLVEKLGIGEGDRVGVIAAPDNLGDLLADLPAGGEISPLDDKKFELVLWFVRSPEDLSQNLEGIVAVSKRAPVWIIWPKKSSKLAAGLSQPLVRQACMERGMVDYKVCSVDQTWTGLLFKWRG